MRLPPPADTTLAALTATRDARARAWAGEPPTHRELTAVRLAHIARLEAEEERPEALVA